MRPIQKKREYAARLKSLMICTAVFILVSISSRAFSQSAPPPGPPPPPPGQLFKKINPFKKHKDTANKKDTAKAQQTQLAPPPGGPPPPPNPLNLFKKKKKDTTKKAPAPAPGTGN